jgi:hypothetical protein
MYVFLYMLALRITNDGFNVGWMESPIISYNFMVPQKQSYTLPDLI